MRRLALRQAKAAARLQAHYDFSSSERLRTAAGSALARAIDYSLKRWAALQFNRADGALLPIDNNPAENAIRPIALRKNWLFVGSERARRRHAGTAPMDLPVGAPKKGQTAVDNYILCLDHKTDP